MNFDIALGTVIFVLAYGFLLYLIIWCRNTINMIDKRNIRSLREISEEIHNGR
ncbi:MAG: hypothetical protein SVR08_03280 [Spirochaetota bacterium]|nr:hypothetical protein [Spirochaetota bacterium]